MPGIAEIFEFSLQDRASAAKEEAQNRMANMKECLEEAMQIEGAIGVALVDWKSGMCLGTAGGSGSLNLEIAAAGNTETVRSKMKAMQSLGIRDQIEDILISLTQQYHLIRLLSDHPGLFLYLVLNRKQANLALARYKLTQLDESLKL